jgi:hypothetical protein
MFPIDGKWSFLIACDSCENLLGLEMTDSIENVARFGKLFSADFASIKWRFETCQNDTIERRKQFKRSACRAIRDYDTLLRTFETWKDSVAAGRLVSTPPTAHLFHSAFSKWFHLADFIMHVWDDNEQVRSEPASWLRHRRDAARRIVENWQTPVARIPNDVAAFLASLTNNRTPEELGSLDRLAEKVTQRIDAVSELDVDAWAERLASDLVKHED